MSKTEPKKHIIVLEIPCDNRTEWGISFTSHNPQDNDYFECLNKDEAFRLAARIEQFAYSQEYLLKNSAPNLAQC